MAHGVLSTLSFFFPKGNRQIKIIKAKEIIALFLCIKINRISTFFWLNDWDTWSFWGQLLPP